MSSETVLQVQELKKYFPIRKGIFKRTVGWIRAVDDVSFAMSAGQTLGLVGESGCGKTTTGRCILRLVRTDREGSILYRLDDQLHDIVGFNHSEMKRVRQKMQIIFQDPFSSLDPQNDGTRYHRRAASHQPHRHSSAAELIAWKSCWIWLD